MNEKLKQVEALLRDIYKDNDGPRLINEMVKADFPYPRGPQVRVGEIFVPMAHNLR